MKRTVATIATKGMLMSWGFFQSPEPTFIESDTAQEEAATTAATSTGREPGASAPELKKDWRFCSGMAALGLACVMPLFGLAVPWLGLSTAWTVALTAAFIGGGPEVLLLLAAVLLGKETMHYFLVAAKCWLVELVSFKPVAKRV